VLITIFLTDSKIDLLQKSDPWDEEVTKNSLLQEFIGLSVSLTDESLRQEYRPIDCQWKEAILIKQ
jgi:hypothetical protein